MEACCLSSTEVAIKQQVALSRTMRLVCEWKMVINVNKGQAILVKERLQSNSPKVNVTLLDQSGPIEKNCQLSQSHFKCHWEQIRDASTGKYHKRLLIYENVGLR